MTQSDNQLSGKGNVPSQDREAEGKPFASSSENDPIPESNPEMEQMKDQLACLELALNSAQTSRLMLLRLKKEEEKQLRKKKKRNSPKKLRKQLRKTLQQNILLCQEIIEMKTKEIEAWRQQLEESITKQAK